MCPPRLKTSPFECGILLAVLSGLLLAHFGEQFMFAEPRIHCHGYTAKPAKHRASGMWLTNIFSQRVHSPPSPTPTHPPTPALHLAFRNPLLKHLGEFGALECKPPLLLLLALLKYMLHSPSSQLMSVDWHYCSGASGPKFGWVTTST